MPQFYTIFYYYRSWSHETFQQISLFPLPRRRFFMAFICRCLKK